MNRALNLVIITFFFLIYVGCPGQLTRTTTIPHGSLDILQAQEQVRHRGGDRRTHRGSNLGRGRNKSHELTTAVKPSSAGYTRELEPGHSGRAKPAKATELQASCVVIITLLVLRIDIFKFNCYDFISFLVFDPSVNVNSLSSSEIYDVTWDAWQACMYAHIT
jgi:hypothetical protein